MSGIKLKQASPGRRAVVKVVHKYLHKGKSEASLLEPQFQHSGRNKNVYINIRLKGGGHKHHYRVVDFVRNKDGIPAKVERIEYDPNRTAHIALVCYADGERRYIIAPRGLEVGSTIVSGAEAPIKAGNTLPIRNIPLGSTVHCVEMLPGKGAHIARSAGTSVTLIAREGTYAQLRLRSGEVRKIHIDCRATIGEVSNEEHSLRQYGKGGVMRRKGMRSTVRGVAMIPNLYPIPAREGHTDDGLLPAALRGPVHPNTRAGDIKRPLVDGLRLDRSGTMESQVAMSGMARVRDLFEITPVIGDELEKLMGRIPATQRNLVASEPSRVTMLVGAMEELDQYADKLMAPLDSTIAVRLIEAPVSDEEIAGSVAVGFFSSGAIRTIGTVATHTATEARIAPYNVWSLIDPFDSKQEFKAKTDLEVDLQVLLLLDR